VLIGSAAGDDAGVYLLDSERALVQTADFFTPVVDDGYTYGRIAAANALSDVYAMGGRPLSALNVLGYPPDKVPDSVIAEILRGGADTAHGAGCAVIGGHTVRNPEPIYGMAVTGMVHPDRLLTKAAARPGDLLMLTKPLGTGIITTALKRGSAPARAVERAVTAMMQLNRAGPDLAAAGVAAATDVTGFGLTGHLADLCAASSCGAELWYDRVPMLDDSLTGLIADGSVPGGTADNLAAAEAAVDWGTCPESIRVLLADAQTSGGLLLCVPEAQHKAVRAVLAAHGALDAVVGRITTAQTAPVVITAGP
jgi:selenide,water dikinase